MRRERDDLMMKLQESESRHEELSGSLSSSTRPLLRQIESLQASLSEAQTNRYSGGQKLAHLTKELLKYISFITGPFITSFHHSPKLLICPIVQILHE